MYYSNHSFTLAGIVLINTGFAIIPLNGTTNDYSGTTTGTTSATDPRMIPNSMRYNCGIVK
jgi:hypothetical protein